ncbi:MAG TPA: AsmA-like C-terminal region-containing protein [Candidatus Krumholzibacteria bacterium]
MSTSWHRRRRFRVPLALATVFVLLAVALRVFLPAERWKEIALRQLEERTGLKATAGPASIQFPWPLGLQVAELRIDDVRGDQAYQRLELQAESVLISANLASILRRKPRIDEIRLRAPRVEIWLQEARVDGPIDAAPPAPGATHADATASTSDELAAVLTLLAIDQGSLNVHLADGAVVAFAEISQRAGGRLDGRRFSAQCKAEVGRIDFQREGERRSIERVEFTLRVEGSTAADRLDATVQLERFTAEGLSAEGTIALGGTPAALELDLTLDVAGELSNLFELAKRQEAVPAELLDALTVEAGSLSAKVGYLGVLPAGASPEELLAQARVQATLDAPSLTFHGETLSAARLELEQQDGGWGIRIEGIRGAGFDLSGTANLPLLGEGEMVARFAGKLDAAAARAAAARVWPRLSDEQTKELPGPDEWPQLSGNAEIEVTLRSPLPSPTDPTQIALRAVVRPRPLAVTPVGWSEAVHITDGTLVIQPTELSYEALAVRGPGFSGSVSGAAWGWPEAMEMELDAAMQGVDVEKLQAASRPAEETAWLLNIFSTSAHAAGVAQPFVPPADLGAEIVATVVEFRSNGYTVRNVAATGSLREQRLHVSDIHGEIGSGRVEGSVGVDWTQLPPVFDSKTRMVEVPASELLEPWIPKLGRALDSKFNGEFALLGPMDEDPDRALRALSGQIQLAAGAGTLLTESVLGDALKAFLGDKYEGFRKLSFSGLDAQLSVSDGAIHFDRMFLGGGTELRAAGQMGLDGRCAYSLDCLLPASVTPALGELEPVADLLRDEAGRIRFRVDVSGPAAKPKVQIDWSELATRAADKQKERLRGRVKDEVEDKLKGLLDGLKSKGKGKG